jgi:transposase
VLEGIRWLLPKNPENLDSEEKEKDRLKEAHRLNQLFSCSYYLKEDLRQIGLQKNEAKADRALTDWIKRAQTSGIKMSLKSAKTLAAFRSGILAY